MTSTRSSKTFEEDLKFLGFKLNPMPTITSVSSRYRKLSLTLHPDKGGTHEGFLKLIEVFERVCTYLAKHGSVKRDEDELILMELFRKFNMEKVNIESCTVLLQNGFESEWDTILSEDYGSPSELQHGAKKWHITNYFHGDIQPKDVFVTKWNKPKSDSQTKLLVQGVHHFIYVVHELPRLFKRVYQLSQNEKLILTQSKAKTAHEHKDKKILVSLEEPFEEV